LEETSVEYQGCEGWVRHAEMGREEGQVRANEGPGGVVGECLCDGSYVGFGGRGEDRDDQGRLRVEGLNNRCLCVMRSGQ
jgi:hypothetical protein